MKILSNILLAATLLLGTSCLNQEDGETIPGIKGPKINVQDGKVIVTVELAQIVSEGGATFPIPKLDRSELTVGGTLDGGTIIRAAFDLKDVDSDDFRVVPHQTLPDGRQFPFLIDGTLPAVAINVPKAKDMTFYASSKLFGFFLPLTLPDDFNVGIHYKIVINGKDYGIVSLIHPDSSGNGAGVVVLMTLDSMRDNPEFKKLLKISKRNKSRLY